MVTKARSKLSWVFSVFKTRDRTVMTTLYKSLVRRTLEYCCPLWNPGNETNIQLIEGVQRTFTNQISGQQYLNYWERLAHLKLMSLQRRRDRYVILMMRKILYKVVPNCCDTKFRMASRNDIIAVIPPLAKSSTLSNQTLYNRSFAVQGPRLWNKVPNTVKAAQSFDFDSFKISLSKFLALIPDNPPVSGYNQLQLVKLIGRLHAIEVVRHLITLPTLRINSIKLSQVKLIVLSPHTYICQNLMRTLQRVAYYFYVIHISRYDENVGKNGTSSNELILHHKPHHEYAKTTLHFVERISAGIIFCNKVSAILVLSVPFYL